MCVFVFITFEFREVVDCHSLIQYGSYSYVFDTKGEGERVRHA